MRLYSYVVRVDEKFAPNPTNDYCTLGCCKPKIRNKAEIGDWIIGTGSVQNYGNNKLVYAMKVNEKLTFDSYHKDERFKGRIDNIYFKNNEGAYTQIAKPKYHGSKGQMHHDMGSKYVLISKEFVYYGEEAITIPTDVKWIIKKGPGHKSTCFTQKQINQFVEWILPKLMK